MGMTQGPRVCDLEGNADQVWKAGWSFAVCKPQDARFLGRKADFDLCCRLAGNLGG